MLLTKKVPLSNCKPGEVYSLSYGKNESRGKLVRLGKVMSVRDTVKEPVCAYHKARHRIERSRFLITMLEPNGKLRCFYAESVASLARRLTWIGRAWNWLRGVRFPA
jgi:hypothetical protein